MTAENNDVAIKVSNVSKTFKLPHEKQNSIKHLFINMFRRKRTFEKQRALKDISFEVKKGEFFGIVGRNGSGKSTLLKMLAGIYQPTSGHIQVNGKLTPFIELGVGFNPELTGRENVFLNGALLGFNRKEMLAMYDEIVGFAELEKFMDQKLKNYSSGMQVRLAFSIAIRANTEILLLDEVLAVGDILFQKKCFEYFKNLKRENKTVVLVSHDSNVLEEYCETGILINDGQIVRRGRMKGIVRDYLDIMNEAEKSQYKDSDDDNPAKSRWGTRKMEVITCQIQDSGRKASKIFDENDEDIIIKVDYGSSVSEEGPIYGIVIEDAQGIRVFESNTKQQKKKTASTSQQEKTSMIWKIPNIFNTGTYTVSPAVARHDGTEMYDWRDGLATFKIRKTLQSTALVNVAHTVIKEDESL